MHFAVEEKACANSPIQRQTKLNVSSKIVSLDERSKNKSWYKADPMRLYIF